MTVTDDAFELIRDMDALTRIAKESGNTELIALAINIKARTGSLSRKLTDLLDEKEKIDTDEKTYKMAMNITSAKVGSPGPP